ncbi:MAG: tyrosine-protein phosphatase [Bacteroidales bacterium]
MFEFLFKKKRSEKLFFHTDVHAHFLPGIDDGAKTTESSQYLLESLMGFGVENFVATPHITHETFPNNRTTITDAFSRLQNHLTDTSLNPNIHFSAEYRLDELFEAHRDAGQLIPFPKNYLLIENSFIQPFMGIRDTVFQLQLDGYKPILAHPERYPYYHTDKTFYDEMHAQGCLYQVNLLSFSGLYGPEVKQVAYQLLKKGYVDFIGTDTHHRHHIEAIKKFMQTSDYAKLEKGAKNILNNILFE